MKKSRSVTGIRKYKSTTPGRRGASVSDFAGLIRSTPEKPLLVLKPKTGGCNNPGHITTRYIGGGHKQAYRIIDFKCYDKDGVPVKVARIEHDPNCTARIALLHYHNGEKRYIIAPSGLTQGTVVVSGPGSNIKPGNNLELWQISVGTAAHAVEPYPGDGAKLDRPAGAVTQLVAREGKYATLRMLLGGMRMVDVRCRATTGMAGNAEQLNTSQGKAGRNRWRGIHPIVRGVVMNPVDHSHGGGEDRTSGGRHLMSPRGKPEGRTRDKNKASSRLTVCRRKTGKKR